MTTLYLRLIGGILNKTLLVAGLIMNIVVTTKGYEYNKWLKLPSLKAAFDVRGSIDVLVYNTSVEGGTDALEKLVLFKERNSSCRVVYVCNEEDTDNAVKMLIVGGGGKYVDDDFYLTSEADLESMLSGIDEVTDIVDTSNIGVVSDFFNRFLSGQQNPSKAYLELVKKSVSSIVESNRDKELELVRLSETASDVFMTSIQLISNAREEHEKLEKSLSEIEKLSSTATNTVAPSTYHFPTVTYLKSRKVIRIRDIDRVLYGTSFVLGLWVYLERMAMMRPKLLIIEPLGTIYEKKYSGFQWVTKQSLRSYEKLPNIVFTNYPTKEVVDKFLDDVDCDLFVIYDRSVNQFNHLVNCKGEDPYYLVSGESTVKTMKVSKSRCICSNSSQGGGYMYSIPCFNGYPSDKGSREDIYLRECYIFYSRLLEDIGG